MAKEKNGAVTKRRSTTGGPGTRIVNMDNWREKLAKHRLKFDDRQKGVFLAEFRAHGRVMQAAEAATVSATTIYNHLENDPDFAEAFDEARQHYRDHIREAVYTLAVEGIEEPIIGGEFKDEIVGYKRIMFPNLLAMEAKRVDPDYREKDQNTTVNVQTGVVVLPAPPSSPEDFDKQMEQARLNAPSEASWRASVAAKEVPVEVVTKPAEKAK